MRFEQLQYYIAVAECGSITKASKKLYLSQPALSAAITALERELGAPLLNRSKRGVVPTEFGLKVLEDSKTILSIASEWGQRIPDITCAHGDFHIMALPPDCSLLMKILVPRMMDLYPKLNVFIHESRTQEIRAALLQGKADFYISCYTPEEEDETLSAVQRARYQALTLLEDELQIFISCNNPLGNQPYLTIEDCRSLTLAQYIAHNDYVSHQFSHCFPAKQQIKLSNRESTLELIAQDKAVSYYPVKISAISQYVVEGRIKSIPIQGLTIPTTHFLAYAPLQGRKGLTDHIVNAIRECYLALDC